MPKAKQRWLCFDLRTRVIILLVVNLLFITNSSAFELVLTGSSLLVVALGGQWKSACRFSIAFLVMILIEKLVAPHVQGF